MIGSLFGCSHNGKAVAEAWELSVEAGNEKVCGTEDNLNVRQTGRREEQNEKEKENENGSLTA